MNAPTASSPLTTTLPASMKAIVSTGYGPTDVLEVRTLPRPVPEADEVLIKVHATAVTAADSMMRRGDPAFARLFLGLRRPKRSIPGTGLAGVVEAVGEAVTRFSVGDAVFGEAGLGFGAHAEYLCVPEDGALVPIPEGLSPEDAATMGDGPMTSWNFLRRIAELEPGQRVLINGASGSLGTAAVQIAKALGAEVIGVCSTANVAFVESLGADRVIDYTQQDFTEADSEYDVIYDTVGKSSFSRCRRALTPTGTYMTPVLKLRMLPQMLWTALRGGKRARFDATGLRPADELRACLSALAEMVVAGTLRVVTERVYTLEQIPEAHARVDSGHKRGNLVVRVAPQG